MLSWIEQAKHTRFLNQASRDDAGRAERVARVAEVPLDEPGRDIAATLLEGCCPSPSNSKYRTSLVPYVLVSVTSEWWRTVSQMN